MPQNNTVTFLLASPDPALVAALEPTFHARGTRAEIARSAEDVIGSLSAPDFPGVLLVDANLTSMPTDQLLAAVRSQAAGTSIVLIADTVNQSSIDLLSAGAIDDVILRSSAPSYWQLRIDLLLRSRNLAAELESLRDTAFRNAQFDRLTGIYNRETLLTILFRETDRAQRMNMSLSLVLFDIDDFGHWNSRLGAEACDDLLCQVVARTSSLLRSYDLFGRPGMDEFLVGLPACGTSNAMVLTERLRTEVFASPFHVGGDVIRLSACFGIAASRGRSPVVVLREAEKALGWAKAAGPETIQILGCPPNPDPSPVTFFSSSSGDELLAW